MGAKTSRRRSTIALLLVESVLLIVLGAVLWLKLTSRGQQVLTQLTMGQRIAAEQESAARLRELGVLVIAEPPDKRVTSINFRGQSIDAETMEHVARLFRLQSLDLATTNVSDDRLASIDELAELSNLVLGGTPVTDAGAQHLARLPAVVALHLRGTKISDQGLPDIAKIESLRILDLSETCVTDRGLDGLLPLKRLEWLLLVGNDIGDEGLEQLARIASLKRLTISGTKVTPAGVERIKRALPMLSVDLVPGGPYPETPRPHRAKRVAAEAPPDAERPRNEPPAAEQPRNDEAKREPAQSKAIVDDLFGDDRSPKNDEPTPKNPTPKNEEKRNANGQPRAQ